MTSREMARSQLDLARRIHAEAGRHHQDGADQALTDAGLVLDLCDRAVMGDSR